MKIKFLSALAVCALLSSCGGNAGNNASNTADTQAVEQPAVADNSEKKDWAMDFIKALDKKYFPQEITQADIDQSYLTDGRENEETGEKIPSFSVIRSNEEGCTDMVTAYTFKKKDGKSCFVLLVSEAGCDGCSTTGIRAFTFDGSTIAEAKNPIERPTIDEMTKGIDDPALDDLKKDYYYCEDEMAGLDVRPNDVYDIEIRPGQLGYDDLYEQYTPVVYTFNGETLVKK